MRHWVRNALPRPYRWARDLVSRRPRWEMNTISEHEVREIVERSGGRIVAILEADRDGVFDSRWIVATRPAD
jgi:hypothetical protein